MYVQVKLLYNDWICSIFIAPPLSFQTLIYTYSTNSPSILLFFFPHNWNCLLMKNGSTELQDTRTHHVLTSQHLIPTPHLPLWGPNLLGPNQETIFFFYWLLSLGLTTDHPSCSIHCNFLCHTNLTCLLLPREWNSSLAFIFSSCLAALSSTLFSRDIPHPSFAHAETIHSYVPKLVPPCFIMCFMS